jgi:mannose-6-phosphate isomerase
MVANGMAMYPLRFDPIYQYRLWGGRRLADLLTKKLPAGPVGEAWVLSDRDDHASHVSDGALKGRTIAQLLAQFPHEVMGRLAGKFARFPLLLKFLDAEKMLSVQVHPHGKNGKTEAWVVLEAGADSRIYAGLSHGTTENDLRSAVANGTVAEKLESFHPATGDAFFIPGGTVHSLGGGVVVFEVQQNSDVTYRLYDWGHIDENTGTTRPLQVEQALEAVNFSANEGGFAKPAGQNLIDCTYFDVSRISGNSPFPVGKASVPSVLVCTEGVGRIEGGETGYAVKKGDVYLLPAAIGRCTCRPDNSRMSILGIEIRG